MAATAPDGTADKTAEPKDLADTEDAIRADPRLGDEQKAALIAVYRSMLGSLPEPGRTEPGLTKPGLG